MPDLEVVAINTHIHSSRGPFAVAVPRYSGGYRELFSPVFKDTLAAEVFAEAMPRLTDGCKDAESEIALARKIETFIDGRDETHQNGDGSYPTLDGRYPTSKMMAEWFLAAVQPALAPTAHED